MFPNECTGCVFQKSSKSKKKWFGKQKDIVSDLSSPAAVAEPVPPTLPPQTEEVNLTDGAKEESGHVDAVAIVANSSSNTAAEAVKPTYFAQLAGKSREEAAAIKIQKSFRGYQVDLFVMWDLFLFRFDAVKVPSALQWLHF